MGGGGMRQGSPRAREPSCPAPIDGYTISDPRLAQSTPTLVLDGGLKLSRDTSTTRKSGSYPAFPFIIWQGLTKHQDTASMHLPPGLVPPPLLSTSFLRPSIPRLSHDCLALG